MGKMTDSLDEKICDVCYTCTEHTECKDLDYTCEFCVEIKALIADQCRLARIEENKLYEVWFNEYAILKIAGMKVYPEGTYVHSEKLTDRIKSLGEEA
jgi:hypothetical protein